MTRQMELLVVDDFAPMRNTVRAALEQGALFRVSACGSVAQAKQMMEKQDYDLLLCDVNMPGVSGIEFLQQLRATERYKYLPFVLMTGDGSRSLVTTAIQSNVTGFVVKPFTLSLLKDKVLAALKAVPDYGSEAIELSSEAQAKPVAAKDPTEKPCILVVDDEPVNLELVYNLLKTDYRIKVATSGEKALQLVATEPPDLILLDVMMPSMDGFEVCQRLQSQSKTDIPIIFLTAKTAVADVTRGLGLGAVDYIYKPLEPEILKARIRTQLALRESRQHFRSTIDVLMENARLQKDLEHMSRHDLKNPLSGVLAHLSLLLQDSALPSQFKEQLQQIQQSAQMAMGLVEQSADLMKMEQGSYKLQPEPVDVEALLQQVQQDMMELIHDKHLAVQQKFFMKQPVVRGEQQLCYFIFSNLLKNAIEAAPQRSEIILSVEELETHVAVRFYNDGAIPEGIRHSVFDKYVTSGKSGGTGLGTYSARMMTLVQQGDVSFKVVGNRTVFTVSLPKV